ncbi:unnamed protein product [Ectocarpus sp. 6 AP-2014]
MAISKHVRWAISACCQVAALFMALSPAAPAAVAFCSSSMSTKGTVHVCTNTSCRKAGSRWTVDTFRAFAPPGDIKVLETGCQGRCGLGPNILTRPSEEVYNGVAQPATVAAIIEIDFGVPVADTLVGAFGHVSKGDVLFKRGLFAEALACYSQCIDTAGAFDGSTNALSVAKVKQSSAMRLLAKEGGRGSSRAAGTGSTAAAASVTLEEAEASAREAVELWPAHTAAWLNLADVLVDTGRVQEALETLAELKAQFPDAKFDASEKAAIIRNTQR